MNDFFKDLNSIEQLLLKYQKASLYKKIQILEKIRQSLIGIDFLDIKNKLQDFLNKEKQILQEEKEKEELSFANKLANLCKSINLLLTGNLPTLYAGLYRINVDFIAANATISWGPEVIKRVYPQAEEVFGVIKEMQEALDCPFVALEFFERLKAAYKRCCKLNDIKYGGKAPIIAILAEFVFMIQDDNFFKDPIKKNFKEYNRIQFAYDLYRLKKVYPQSVILYTATFEQTRDKKESLFVPICEDKGSRFSYLLLRE